MNGMEGGSGPTPTANSAGNLQLANSAWLFKQAKPGLADILSQVASILQTGNPLQGIGVPMAQQAVGSARDAANQSMTGADAFLAQNGLQGSPFAAAIKSMITQQGNQAVGQAGTQVDEQLLSMFGGAPQGAAGQASSGLGGLAGQSSSSPGAGGLVGSGLGGLGGLLGGLGGLGLSL